MKIGKQKKKNKENYSIINYKRAETSKEGDENRDEGKRVKIVL